MAPSFIDHLTITAPSLKAGAEYVRHVLGGVPQRGGEHPRMGTHNLLLRLGDSLFLEVIASNPAVPRPDRARWFGLDALDAGATPKLSTWVARTSDIHATAAASSEAHGSIEPMTRGPLNWLITIPADGSLPLDGVAPALIEWHTESHPAASLEDQGFSLEKLELVHPDPDRISALLRSIGLEGPVAVSQGAEAGVVAHINTPNGLRRLAGS
jgi:hypothetical protein